MGGWTRWSKHSSNWPNSFFTQNQSTWHIWCIRQLGLYNPKEKDWSEVKLLAMQSDGLLYIHPHFLSLQYIEFSLQSNRLRSTRIIRSPRSQRGWNRSDSPFFFPLPFSISRFIAPVKFSFTRWIVFFLQSVSCEPRFDGCEVVEFRPTALPPWSCGSGPVAKVKFVCTYPPRLLNLVQWGRLLVCIDCENAVYRERQSTWRTDYWWLTH